MKKPLEKINLQPAHIKVYRFIEKYIAKNVVSPEIRDIAKDTKITLRHTYRIIDDLVTLQYLSRESYKKRSIKIARPLQ